MGYPIFRQTHVSCHLPKTISSEDWRSGKTFEVEDSCTDWTCQVQGCHLELDGELRYEMYELCECGLCQLCTREFRQSRILVAKTHQGWYRLKMQADKTLNQTLNQTECWKGFGKECRNWMELDRLISFHISS